MKYQWLCTKQLSGVDYSGTFDQISEAKEKIDSVIANAPTTLGAATLGAVGATGAGAMTLAQKPETSWQEKILNERAAMARGGEQSLGA